MFRPAAADDAAAIVALVNSGYRGEGSKRGWTTEADLLGGQRTDERGVLEMIVEPFSRVELGFSGERLVSCVHLKKEADASCYLGMLTVDPALQRGGEGRKMLERAEEIGREWGCARMRMTVISLREELISYYERRGYKRTGRTEPFPEDDPRFGLPKVKGLTFVELDKPI